MSNFSNSKDFFAYLDGQVRHMVIAVGEEIKDMIYQYIQSEFYNTYNPRNYERTY